MKVYGVTSTENHIKGCLMIDVAVWVCKEDMERLGIEGRPDNHQMPRIWAARTSRRNSFPLQIFRRKWIP